MNGFKDVTLFGYSWVVVKILFVDFCFSFRNLYWCYKSFLGFCRKWVRSLFLVLGLYFVGIGWRWGFGFWRRFLVYRRWVFFKSGSCVFEDRSWRLWEIGVYFLREVFLVFGICCKCWVIFGGKKKLEDFG